MVNLFVKTGSIVTLTSTQPPSTSHSISIRVFSPLSLIVLQIMKSVKKIIIWHILGSVTFLALPAVLSPHPPEEVEFITSRATIRDFLANGFILIFFYANYYALIPFLYFKRRYIVYILSILIFFLAICILPSLLSGRNPFESAPLLGRPPLSNMDAQWTPPLPAGSTLVQEIKHHVYLYAATVFFSIALRMRLRLLQTEEAKHYAEIVALKDQINPHFLFNTLNGLYALAVRDRSTTTATGILKLSGLMRYVVTETGNGFVALEKEISYINDFIELQKLRLDKRVQLSYQVIGSFGDEKIAPLTLMPFIENAFKHGVNPDEDSSINILIEVKKQEIMLVVENNKVHVVLGKHEKSGKGIQNTKSRLNLLYPSRHFLILDEDDKHFRVQLTIRLL